MGATAVLIPERELDFERDVVEKIRRARLAGTTHYMVVGIIENLSSMFNKCKYKTILKELT